MTKMVKRIAAGLVGGVVALTMAAAPARAAGTLTVDITCDVPNLWGTTCYATATGGIANYSWSWIYSGQISTHTTTTPFYANGVGCPPSTYQVILTVQVRDGSGQTDNANEFITCGWV